MLTLYRNHWIVMLRDTEITAEITEATSGAPLPTKARATLGEGPELCLERARNLIDLYLSAVLADQVRVGIGRG